MRSIRPMHPLVAVDCNVVKVDALDDRLFAPVLSRIVPEEQPAGRPDDEVNKRYLYPNGAGLLLQVCMGRSLAITKPDAALAGKVVHPDVDSVKHVERLAGLLVE